MARYRTLYFASSVRTSMRPSGDAPATARSPSVIAAATHSPLVIWSAPVRPVTSPPPPRRWTTSPSGDTSCATGPRLDAMTTGRPPGAAGIAGLLRGMLGVYPRRPESRLGHVVDPG